MIPQNKNPDRRVFLIVAVLFTVVAGFLIYSRISNNKYISIMHNLSLDEVENVYFYKDFLRDSEGLEIFIEEKEILESLIHYLNNIEETNTAVKTVKIEKSVKIRLYIGDDFDKETELHIMKTREMGNTALISTSIISGNLSTNRGNYTSQDILVWLEDLSKKNKYKRIWEPLH